MEEYCDPRFIKGIEEFNKGLFFECHETLEEIWLEENGEDRKFYQGLIQIAAGYFKWEQGALIGAIKLLSAGLEKLERYPQIHLDVDLGSFIHGVKVNLAVVKAAYQRGDASPELSVPVLTRVSEQ